uniref:Uncharacterized protein n=1 Tax=Daphnia galeata TaxID=27404 RepID=A0A8J2RRM2_9CRUS|nr:unnamed protein product [Daphnia galeata]
MWQQVEKKEQHQGNQENLMNVPNTFNWLLIITRLLKRQRMSQLEILKLCQWQKDKTEENSDEISEAVDLTINKCKGLSSREKEVDRLRAVLASASKEIEESARLMERFQGLHLSDGAKAITSSLAKLIRTVRRYESGTYGLSEATKELKETRDQLIIRNDHIEKLNTLEERIEDLALENSDLREERNVNLKTFDLPLKKMTLNQQRDAHQQEIQQLKEENMQLGLENRSTSTPTATSGMSPSVTTQKAIITLMATSTSLPVSATSSTTISLTSSTKKLNTSSTTPSSVGFINLTNVIDSININYKARRDLSARILRKRSPATTIAPVVSTSDTLTADHIPIYFEQVFFLVQTSLYVCTAAGLLIFFSSLFGICGGLFRIDGCLKFSVAALVLVIMAEMAMTAFIFVAHDKASNRNKNKNFDRDLKLLCRLG